MSKLRRFAVAPGLLAVLVAVGAGRSSFAVEKPDSPEARLRARIADLHAEVAALDVECAAARQNLLESLRSVGNLELGDKQGLLSSIKEEVRQQLWAHPLLEPKRLLAKFLRNAEEERFIDVYLTKEGNEEAKALDRFAELELKARLDSARAESDRMKADFLKKCRLLYMKKLELADAEAEYKATK